MPVISTLTSDEATGLLESVEGKFYFFKFTTKNKTALDDKALSDRLAEKKEALKGIKDEKRIKEIEEDYKVICTPTLITAEYLKELGTPTAEATPVITENDALTKIKGLEKLMGSRTRFISLKENDKSNHANFLASEDFERFGGKTMDEVLFAENVDLYNKIEPSKAPEYKKALEKAIEKRKQNLDELYSFYYNEKKNYDYAFKAMQSPYKALQKSFKDLSKKNINQQEFDKLFKEAEDKSHKLKTSAHEGSNFLSRFADALDDVTPEYNSLHISGDKDGKTRSRLKAIGYSAFRFIAYAVYPLSISRKRSFFKGNGVSASIGNLAASIATSLVVPGVLFGLSLAFPPLAPVFLFTAAAYGILFTLPALVKSVFNFVESLHLGRQKLKTTKMQTKGVDNSLEGTLRKELAKNNPSSVNAGAGASVGVNALAMGGSLPPSTFTFASPSSPMDKLKVDDLVAGKNVAAKVCKEHKNYKDVTLLQNEKTSFGSEIKTQIQDLFKDNKIAIAEIVQLSTSTLQPACYLVRLQDNSSFIVTDTSQIPPTGLHIEVMGQDSSVSNIKFDITPDRATAKEIGRCVSI